MEGAPIKECQYIGPEQDPLRDWPIKYCCRPTFPGKAYCEDHVWIVYNRGSSVGNKRKLKEIEKELAEIKRIQEIEEIVNA
jgi:hypothetical protein